MYKIRRGTQLGRSLEIWSVRKLTKLWSAHPLGTTTCTLSSLKRVYSTHVCVRWMHVSAFFGEETANVVYGGRLEQWAPCLHVVNSINRRRGRAIKASTHPACLLRVRAVMGVLELPMMHAAGYYDQLVRAPRPARKLHGLLLPKTHNKCKMQASPTEILHSFARLNQPNGVCCCLVCQAASRPSTTGTKEQVRNTRLQPRLRAEVTLTCCTLQISPVSTGSACVLYASQFAATRQTSSSPKSLQ